VRSGKKQAPRSFDLSACFISTFLDSPTWARTRGLRINSPMTCYGVCRHSRPRCPPEWHQAAPQRAEPAPNPEDPMRHSPETQKPIAMDGLLTDVWWPGAESNHRHADFQRACPLNTPSNHGARALCKPELRGVILSIHAPWSGYVLATSALRTGWSRHRRRCAFQSRP
jgi:hypothetical protein